MKSPFPLILLLSFLVSCTSPEEQALEATLTFAGTNLRSCRYCFTITRMSLHEDNCRPNGIRLWHFPHVGTSGMYFSHYQQRQFFADGSGCGHFLRMYEGEIRQASRSAGTDDGFESEIRSGGKRTFHKSGDCIFECRNFPRPFTDKGGCKINNV